MLRITTWRITAAPPPDTTPMAAMQAFGDMCSTLERVQGAGRIRFYLGDGGIVTVGEPESYAVADSILTSRDAQVAVAKVLSSATTSQRTTSSSSPRRSGRSPKPPPPCLPARAAERLQTMI